MSVAYRLSLGALAVALLARSPSPAQVTGGTNGTKKSDSIYKTETAPAYHTSTVGRGGSDTSGYASGYDRRRSTAFLSTAPGVAPATTAPAFSSAMPYSPWGFTPYYAPPWAGFQGRTGATLQGLASLTSATGQYYQDIQQARISREQSRQMSLETTRQRLQLQMDYERNRPTATKMMAQQRATDLEWARNFASRTEIASGSTLNVLMRSIMEARNPTGGPNIPLTADTLRGLNLTDRSSRGNLTLTKDDGKIDWTEALQEAGFDTARDAFSKNFAKATEYVNQGKTPDIKLVRELRADLKSMSDRLEEEVADLPPSRYIESRRLLNRLGDTVKGLSDSRLVKASASDWRRNVKNVSDLVGHMMKNGLEFGPAAAPGDFAAYSAAYFAIRAYEREVAMTSLETKP